jgi:glycosyltransferase involved in cell wall biosynthesis
MRIIHVVPKPPFQGGLETFAGQLCEQLVLRGHDVTWYCLNKSLDHKSKKSLEKGFLIKEFKPLFEDPLYVPPRDFITELRRDEADIIHLHNIHTLLPLLVLSLNNLSSRIVLQPHYHAQGQNSVRNAAFYLHTKFLKLAILPHFSAIVVNSKFEQTGFTRDFPEASQRVVLMPEEYSIDIPLDIKWNPRKHSKKILYVGALKKYKNVDILIHAFKFLVLKLGNLELTIVGKGTQKESLMKLATNLGVADLIVWKSDLTTNELLKEYVEASVVVHLSELESFSRVVHEAMAIGVPLVIYDHGALGPLVKEGLAKGVKSLNPTNVAEGIATVLKKGLQQRTPDFRLKGETYVGSIEKLYQYISNFDKTKLK